MKSMSMLLACTLAGALIASGPARAYDGSNWSVKAGGHYLSPKGSNGSLDLDDGFGRREIDVDDSAMFTLAVAYHFTEHWSMELFGSAPFQLDMDLEGLGTAEAGMVPLTLGWIYTFNPDGRWRPYLGAGVTAAMFFDEDPSDMKLDDDLGPAAIAGLDFAVTRSWFLNLDVRWIDIDTEAKIREVPGDAFRVAIDPLMVGLMVGYRFGRHEPEYVAAAPVAAAAMAAPEPAAAPPAAGPCADGDGDGVCDVDDKCPNTPAGDTVDRHGCSLVSRLMLFFDFDSAELRPESLRELERVTQFMNQIPEATALIEGHTDSIGTEEYNLGLSERRAKSVYDYLVSRGIDPARLQSLGKGESQPIADNSTEAGRQQNRRVMLIRTDSGR